ncbi:MAG: hypothetical protein IH629_04050, partial [Thermoleophilia bacterium]|nr:hypothetical protein [Thermoleophilia bacterium]
MLVELNADQLAAAQHGDDEQRAVAVLCGGQLFCVELDEHGGPPRCAARTVSAGEDGSER